MTHRSGFFLFSAGGVLIALLGLLAGVAAQGPAQPTAFDMLAALNEWRLEENLAPFRPNPTLEALAMLQARYLLAQDDIPPNIHDGITGERPRQRARWDPYNWPYYDIPARLNLEEISVAQHTVEEGIDWWKHSDIHRRAATNPNYREVGVVALPYAYGTLFVAVLGGRPNVFPALIHPDGRTLYLTRETYWGARGDSYLVNVTEVRLLEANRTPLTDWQPWQATLPMPAISGDTFYVEYTDGEQTVATEVDVHQDIFPLPDYVRALAALTPTPEALTILTSSAGPDEPVDGADVVLMAGPRSLVLRVEAEAALYQPSTASATPGRIPATWSRRRVPPLRRRRVARAWSCCLRSPLTKCSGTTGRAASQTACLS